MNWEDILKVQVLDTSTGLSTISEPMVEDRNCCEEAREEFLNIQMTTFEEIVGKNPPGKKEYENYFIELINGWSCEKFRQVLEEYGKKYQSASHIPYRKTLRFWEECEK